MCRFQPSVVAAPEHTDAAESEVSVDVEGLQPCIDGFRNLATSEVLPEGRFTDFRELCTGIAGDVFSCCDGALGTTVAVKKVRNAEIRKFADTEADERRIHFRQSKRRLPPIEDAGNEIGVLRHLATLSDRSRHLITLKGVFASEAADETWLVTELCEGGELFDAVQQRGALPASEAQRFCWQLLDAVGYLHQNFIAHRDISLENTLLKEGTVRLMDFGVATRSHSSCGVAKRFFRPVGKEFYRAPEAWTVSAPECEVVVPDGAQGGEIVQATVQRHYLLEVKLPADAKPCTVRTAELAGYEAAPVDAFACGVALFIMLFGNPVFCRATMTDATFAFLRSAGLPQLLKEWGFQLPQEEAMDVVLGLLSLNPVHRWPVRRALDSAWLAPIGVNGVASP